MFFVFFRYVEKIKNINFNDKYKQSFLRKFRSWDIESEVEYLTYVSCASLMYVVYILLQLYDFFCRDMITEMDPVVVFCHNDVQEGIDFYL